MQKQDRHHSRRITSKKSLFSSTCCHGILHRMTRIGFLEESLWCYLGLYPWECSGCGRRILRMDRGFQTVRGNRQVSTMVPRRSTQLLFAREVPEQSAPMPQ